MCFSAIASFTAAALLIPTGLYACKFAWDRDIRYLPLAFIPCAFGIQQGFEGVEWLGLAHQQIDLIRPAALGFLFFSHWFWLIWIALAVFFLEHRIWVKRMMLAIMVLGFLFGSSLYEPFLFKAGSFLPTVAHSSIDYQTQLIYDRWFPRYVSRFIYLLIVVGPFWLAQSVQLKLFGSLVALSLIGTYLFYNYAFASVWCFFAAVLSLYIVYVVDSSTALSTNKLGSS
ncbi:DUF6629 family protein [Leptothoe sp. PORK10 BA2]|uniref:DUF6629 family protein n=1 Tax=Leptothoe sp. PORK10 BA2 TaxID=3110254 RepID=UPI002B21D026|nr:DUF6629 family protein [Leptothoe sp. PORK10 BA2]MEA5464850.1 DUF6629 family protein [Leptothoe sp. PORK10 BA2]